MFGNGSDGHRACYNTTFQTSGLQPRRASSRYYYHQQFESEQGHVRFLQLAKISKAEDAEQVAKQ
jgi:hypothetical protein